MENHVIKTDNSFSYKDAIIVNWQEERKKAENLKQFAVNRNTFILGQCSLPKMFIIIVLFAIILGLIDLIVLISHRKYKDENHSKIVILENPRPINEDADIVDE